MTGVAPTAPGDGIHPRERLRTVDGLRALGAFSVVAYHVGLACGLTSSGAFGSVIAELKAGVGLFFVISGFVLHLPYARELFARQALPDWREFLKRRVVRIVPGYWLALTVCAVTLPASSILGPNGWRYCLLAQIYDPDTILSGLAVAWSLCVEISFYLLLPLLAAAMGRLAGAPRRAGPAAAQWLVVGPLAVASLVARITLTGSLTGEVPHAGFVAMTALPGFFDWFAIGMGLAIVAASLERGGEPPRAIGWLGRRPAACGLLAVALLGLAAAVQPDDLFLSLYGPASHMLVGVAAGLLVLAAVLRGHVKTPRSGPVRRGILWLGAVSYGIYLWHMLVLDAVVADTGLRLAPRPGPIAIAGLLIAVALGAAGCAAASWYGLERPLKRLVARAPALAAAGARA